MAREGRFKIGEPLCNFLPMLGSLLPAKPHELSGDAPPTEPVIGDIPSWAFDMFTREGRSAIGRLLARDSAPSRWTKKHVPRDKRVEFLGNVIFAVEGGLLKSRLGWSVGELLRQCAEFECQGSFFSDAREICPSYPPPRSLGRANLANTALPSPAGLRPITKSGRQSLEASTMPPDFIPQNNIHTARQQPRH